MGGSSSGRWGGRPTVERCLTLDLPDLFREGRWKPNAHKGGALILRDGYTEDVVGSLTFQANLGDESGRVHIAHGNSSYWLHLVTTAQPFGGRRWWIICPLTGERVLKLHKPGGARQFASRKAHRLGYNSQRQSPKDRALTQSFKISDQYENEDGELVKPKWMRWATFDREMAKLDRYEGTTNEALAYTAAKLLRRFGPDRN